MRNLGGKTLRSRRNASLRRTSGSSRFGRDYWLRLESLEDRLVLTSVFHVEPTANSHTASVATDVSATLVEPVNPATVNDQTFVLHGMQSGHFVDPPNTVESSGEVISYSPGFGINFFPGELVQATITSGLQNNAGQSTSSHVWQFRIKPQGGSGFFSENGQTLGALSTFGLGLGDLDGDADLDAFVATDVGRQIWLNHGDGTFTFGKSLDGNGGVADVLLGDVNGDGRLDAVAGHVYINGGNNTFSVGQSLQGTSLGDVDGDGDLDLLGNSIWLNDGAGTFTPGQSVGEGAFGDLDADGDLDAFVILSGGNGNQVWINDGGGNFTNTKQSLGGSDSRTVSMGDVDGDGDLDAFVGNGSGQADRIWLNNGDGLLFTDSGQALGNVDTRAAELADLNGDGDLDLFITSVNSQVWLNDGRGNFSVTDQDIRGAAGGVVALGDLDADGDLDAVLGQEANFPDQVWLNLQTVPAAPDRFESNDSSATAVNLDTVPFHLSNQLSQEHPGLSIHNDTDQDWFRYTAPENGQLIVDVQFRHALGDLDVQLFDKALTELAHAKTQSDNEQIVYPVTAEQVVYIKVFGFRGATYPDYELIVSGSAYPPDAFEGAGGNDSMETAARLDAVNVDYDNLTIHNAGNEDWFKFTAPSNDAHNVSILFDDAEGDLDLRIVDRLDNELAISETSDNDEHVTFPGTAGETYFIHVFGYQDATHPNYTLRLGERESIQISDIPNQSIHQDSSTGPVPFTVLAEGLEAPLTISGSSSNPDLVPNSNIVFGDNAASRTVTVTPAAGQTGTAAITVLAKAGSSVSTTFQVKVTKVNRPPVITSSATARVPENTKAVMTVTASDPDGDLPTFSISGGADEVAFAMNDQTGALSFIALKDFEAPQDADGDNVYEVQINADDGNGHVTTQLIRVQVTDTDESVPTVRVEDVSPNPRADAVDQISVLFSKPIREFDKSDLSLTRTASSTESLPLEQAILKAADDVSWTLTNLGSLTSAAGVYELTLRAAGSGITDTLGMALVSGDTSTWINGPGDANEDGSFD